MRMYIVLMLVTAVVLAQEQQVVDQEMATMPWQNTDLDTCTKCRKKCVQVEFMCTIRECGIKNAHTIDCKNTCSDHKEVAECLGTCNPFCPVEILTS